MATRKPSAQSSQKTPAKRNTTSEAPARRSNATRGGRGSHVYVGIAYIALGVLLAAYLIFGAVLYLTDQSGSVARAITSVVPYPATLVNVPGYLPYFLLSILMTVLLIGSFLWLVYLVATRRFKPLRSIVLASALLVISIASMFSVSGVGTSVISYGSYLERVAALDTFQTKQKEQSQAQPQATPQQDLGKDDIKARALGQLVQGAVFKQEAEKYDVKITSAMVDETYKQFADRTQGEDNLKKQLKDFFGWSPAQFKREVRVNLIQRELNTKLAGDDEINADRKKQAEDFLGELKGGADFAEVAKKSSDPTAQNGGDLGFVKKGESDPKVEEVAFTLGQGNFSDIIKTERGYVIIKVEEKQAEQVRLRQILVPTRSVQDFIPEELKNAKVDVYVKSLVWDATLSTVQPKNAAKPEDQPVPEESAVPGTEPDPNAAPAADPNAPAEGAPAQPAPAEGAPAEGAQPVPVQ